MVADLGAGTGRDAGWLAARGHHVTAVEPAAGLRAAGARRHGAAAITWCDDRLPDLCALTRSGRRFDCVLVSGVWQHLTDPERHAAMQSVAAIAAPSAGLIVSLRHGPGAADRPVIDADAERAIAAASAAGFTLRRRVPVGSLGAANRRAGVRWTWLALARA